MTIDWTFFPSSGGEDRGFHDAGVETFKGPVERYIARESIQNSLDARAAEAAKGSPVIVRFEQAEISAVDIPDLGTLAKTFKQCADYWPGDRKATEFFERAQTLARKKSITALRIGDWNTTGLFGSDSDRKSNWYNLTRSSGSSSKGGGEGGSFGIGKNAPFAASAMRCVLYSTETFEGDHAFQGVARLVTHKRAGTGVVQPTAYLGQGKGGASVRKKTQIPKAFARHNAGTDLYILGYLGGPAWEHELTRSVLENFWPAIHNGTLEVVVGATRVTKKNLAKLLAQYSTDKDFIAHEYYRAYTDPEARQFDEKLPLLRGVSARFLIGDAEFPNRVAMVRKTGMVIYHKLYRSVVPFIGVFECRNDAGNKLLREMEPPRHDLWDPDHPEKGQHRKTEQEFNAFLRDCIAKLAPIDDAKSLSIPDLSRWLPDDGDDSEEEFEADAEATKTKKEQFTRQPESRKIESRKMAQGKQMEADDRAGEDGDLETEGESQDGGTGGGPGGGPNDGDDGDGGGGGEGGGGAAPRSGKTGGRNSKPSVPVDFRTFPLDAKRQTYAVSVKAASGKRRNVLLQIKAVGDDTVTGVSLESVALEDGGQVPLKNGDEIGPIALESAKPVRLRLKLREPARLSMEVLAHEA